MKELSDAKLVELYARERDEGAFAEIARRHGSMVYATCQRLLGSAADDAAQAVFMLLARKAGSLSRREALAGWLHGAARLVAREHLRATGRRQRAEKEAAEMRAASKSESSREWNSVRSELDAAIEKLPRHYREAVLLSCVEGRGEAEAARELGVPAGTVKSRVSRGLEKLRERLAHRGRVLGVGTLAVLLAEHGTLEMPVALATKIAGLGAAAAGVGAASASLLMMEGALKAMMMFKIKVAAAVLGTVLVAGTAVPVAQQVIGAEPVNPVKPVVKEPPRTDPPKRRPKAEPVKKPAKVAWGKAANGLQVGLVPLGGGAAAKWARHVLCPGCEAKLPKSGPGPQPGGGAVPCSSCGLMTGARNKFCGACAEAKRVCMACGKAKPWSATFIAGQPIRLELHYRNVGKKDLDIENANWCDLPNWRLKFRPLGGGAPLLARCTAKLQHAGQPNILLKKGQQAGRCFVLGKWWEFQPMVMARSHKTLPPGKYRVTAGYSQNRKGNFWQGSITTGPVEIEVKGKGAAARPAGGKAVKGLSLRLVATKTKYAAGEPLEIRAFLDNVGKERMTVLKRTTHVDMGFNARSAGGQFIVSMLPPAPPRRLRADDLAQLAAGASLELKNWEMLARVNSQIRAGKGRTGKFTIFASYGAHARGEVWNVRKIDPKAWVGSLKSNPVEIRIGIAAAAGGGKWQDLFATKDWYKNQRGAEQVFKGKLVAVGRAGGDSTLMRTSHYKLGERTIYTGARKSPALDKLVGKNVEIRGKPVDMNLEGQSLKEIWPAAVRATK